MDLKEFVQATLVQIAEGIAAANEALTASDTGAIINPGHMIEGNIPTDLVRPVEFDVALTVTSESNKAEGSIAGAKGGILSVASIKGELTSKSTAARREEAISRVRFVVQMQQPGNVEVSAKRISQSRPTSWMT